MVRLEKIGICAKLCSKLPFVFQTDFDLNLLQFLSHCINVHGNKVLLVVATT